MEHPSRHGEDYKWKPLDPALDEQDGRRPLCQGEQRAAGQDNIPVGDVVRHQLHIQSVQAMLLCKSTFYFLV